MNGKLAAYNAKLVKMEGSPPSSLTRQVEFVDDEIDELKKWLSASSVEEKMSFEEKIQSLRGVKRI